MKSSLFISSLVFTLLGGNCVIAYELHTHAQMTFTAFNRSILVKDTKVAQDLGLDVSNSKPLTSLYYDGIGRDPQQRKAMAFEADKIKGANSLSVAGWLMRGAIREDDLTTLGCRGNDAAAQVHNRDTSECNPQDANPNVIRVVNHFFDPYNSRGFGSNVKAPDWATGVKDAFDQPNNPDAGRGNHFSLIDARRGMYAALSGRDPYGTPMSEQSRNIWWATTFRSLGDAMHLLQDMAQPQHTRDEAHPGSTYEAYIEARATGATSFKIDGQDYKKLPALNFFDYKIPKFTRYSDFWSTGRGDFVMTGKGLADYSNRGFFTEGKNFASSGARSYPLPTSNRADYTEEASTFPELNGFAFPVVKFFRGTVPDTHVGESSPIRMTTESMLSRFHPRGVFSLNRYVYNDQVDLLVPRAIAYSAGLLDFFFRGKIDCKPDPTTPGACRIQNLGAESMKGTFAFFYDDADGYRWPVPNGRWEGITLNPNDGLVVAFNPPTNPAPKNPGEYMLVFNGDIGEEKATGDSLGAVTGKLIKAPSRGLVVTPNFVVSDGVMGARNIYHNGSEWTLNPASGIAAGNIDWKGWYEDGKPTRVLTWKGPRNRYLTEPGFRSPFSTEIYQSGEVFAVAPKSVLGAALTKDAAGKEWIIAIVADQFLDVAYRRPNQKSTSSALFNATAAPDGWQEIGRNDRRLFSPERAWFFNGAGTEAQTIKIPASGLGRIQVSATNTEAAIFSDIPFVGVPYEKSPPRIIKDFAGPTSESACMNGSKTFYLFQTRYNDVESETGGTGPAFAVDYIDNRLVMASSESVNYTSSHLTESLHYAGTQVWFPDRYNYKNCEGGARQTTFTTDVHYLKVVGTNGTKTRLKLGDVAVDIPVNERVDTLESSGPDWNTATPSTFQTYSDFNSNRFSVAYLDLRDGFYALYRNQKKGRSDSVLTSKERVDLSDGRSISLGDANPNRFFSGGQFNLTNDAYSIGYGRDLSGNSAFSMRFIKQAEPFSDIPIYFDFLSGGSLRTLITPAPASAMFAPIGVIR